MHQERTNREVRRTERRRKIRTEFDFADDMRLVGRKSAREEKFRQRFVEEVPKEEELINYYSCAYNKDYYLQHGALYVTSNYICFRSNIFGQERKFVIPTADVTGVHKVNTFRLIPSGIVIVTDTEKYNFESFMNRNSAYDTLKRVAEKRTTEPVSSGTALRQDGLLSANRFIKSQSSCSLDRIEKGGDDTKEDFLRPLSATVMHDFVTRRLSQAAVLSGTGPVPVIPGQPRIKRRDSVDGSFAREKISEADEIHLTELANANKAGIEFQWHQTEEKYSDLNIRISMPFLIRLGYVLCFMLTLSAILALTNVFFANGSHKPTARSGSDDVHRLILDNIDLKPFNATLTLLSSVCDATLKLIQQTQRHLQTASNS